MHLMYSQVSTVDTQVQGDENQNEQQSQDQPQLHWQNCLNLDLYQSEDTIKEDLEPLVVYNQCNACGITSRKCSCKCSRKFITYKCLRRSRTGFINFLIAWAILVLGLAIIEVIVTYFYLNLQPDDEIDTDDVDIYENWSSTFQLFRIVYASFFIFTVLCGLLISISCCTCWVRGEGLHPSRGCTPLTPQGVAPL